MRPLKENKVSPDTWKNNDEVMEINGLRAKLVHTEQLLNSTQILLKSALKEKEQFMRGASWMCEKVEEKSREFT